MTRFTPRKSSPRLPTFEYKGAYAYFVTINTDDNRPYLRGGVARRCVELLLASTEDARFENTAYCVTPNHLHLLTCGLDETSDLMRFMQRFKQLTGFAFKKATAKPLWHRSYYDHVLRDDDGMEEIAAHVWLNPVKAGLIAAATDFEFSRPSQYLGRFSDRAEALSLPDATTARWDEVAGH
jgi:putative transposase